MSEQKDKTWQDVAMSAISVGFLSWVLTLGVVLVAVLRS